MTDLLVQLAERIRYSPAVEGDNGYFNDAGEVFPPRPPNSRIARDDIAYVEAQLGFPLPRIVRQIANEVADVGFGPEDGINRLRHPANLAFGPHWEVKMSVESWHRFYDTPDDKEWLTTHPNRFIRFCEVGCNISICVDCTSDSGELFLDDPNETDPVIRMGLTVEEWLSKWLVENPWPKTLYA